MATYKLPADLGWPTIDPAEKVRNWPARMNSVLASIAKSLGGDQTWSTDITKFGNQPGATLTACAITKRGDRAEVYIAGTLTAAIGASASGDYANVNLSTLPAAYKPDSPQGVALMPGVTGPPFHFWVTYTGVLQLVSGPATTGGFPAGQAFTCQGTYLVGRDAGV